MGKPTLDEFRRWLQNEIRSLESAESTSDSEMRQLQLDLALQEAMSFQAAWDIRKEAEIQPVVQERAVRLISSAPAVDMMATSGTCPNCEAMLAPDLDFCDKCGQKF
ncbi:MAG: zinc ribbon domain-containing protein [Candidatus Thermoplasmatota archaeon]|nr:zinc ribbon domain-containing protein [Candidatus Thermoplasmatota archaeon]